jgi:hypothetical protein
VSLAGGTTVGGGCATGGGRSVSGDSERGGEGSFTDGAVEVFDGGFIAAFRDLLEV